MNSETTERIESPVAFRAMLLHNTQHVKRVRTVMLWSAISLLVVFEKLTVLTPNQNSINLSLIGLSIDDITKKNVLWFLFVMTGCYAVAFGYSILRVYLLMKIHMDGLIFVQSKIDEAKQLNAIQEGTVQPKGAKVNDEIEDDRVLLSTYTKSELLNNNKKEVLFFAAKHKFLDGIGTIGGLVVLPSVFSLWAIICLVCKICSN